MLSKNRRIPRKEFDYVLKNSIRYNSPIFVLYRTPNPEKETKVSFSVSKKVFPKAVDRNKHRRRGYSAVSKIINKIKPGFYLFFVFKKTQKQIHFSVVENDINKLLFNADMLI